MPHFCPFHSTMSRFWVTSLFWAIFELSTNFEWPKITLICSRLNVSICIQHTPPKRNFNPFHSIMSRYRVTPAPFSSKSTLNDPNFRPFPCTMSRFWVTAQFSEKCTKWPQMTLTCSRSKYQHACYIHPEAQIFVRLALRWALFELRPNFGKSAQNDPKWPWHVQGQKYKHVCYIHAWGPNFRPFRSTMSPFWGTAQFSEKCTEWPQMTLTCSRSKIPTCILQTPLRPKFPSASHYDEPFLSYGPISGKVHRMTPNNLDMYQVKNTNMYATYTRKGQIFNLFCSMMSHFWVTA